jgi:hypothetical protein
VVQEPLALAELIRTVVAVTAPLVAAEPKALTQSPTARSVEAAVWVALTVVVLDVVTVSFSVLGVAGLLVLLELFDPLLEKLPSARVLPETLSVDPLTALTLPVTMDIDANCLRKLLAPEPPLG